MLTIFEQERLIGYLEGFREGLNESRLKRIHQLLKLYPDRPKSLDKEVDKIKQTRRLKAILDMLFSEETSIEEITQRVKSYAASSEEER